MRGPHAEGEGVHAPAADPEGSAWGDPRGVRRGPGRAGDGGDRRVRHGGGPPGAGRAREMRGTPASGRRHRSHGRGAPAIAVGRSRHEGGRRGGPGAAGRPTSATGGRPTASRDSDPPSGLGGRERRPQGAGAEGQTPPAPDTWPAPDGSEPPGTPPGRAAPRRQTSRPWTHTSAPWWRDCSGSAPGPHGSDGTTAPKGRAAKTWRESGRGGPTAAAGGPAPPHRHRRGGWPAGSRGVWATHGSLGRGGDADEHAAMGARPLGGRRGSSGRRRPHRAGGDEPAVGGAPRGPGAAAGEHALAPRRGPGHGRPGSAGGAGEPARGTRGTHPGPGGPARGRGSVGRQGGPAPLARGGLAAQGRRGACPAVGPPAAPKTRGDGGSGNGAGLKTCCSQALGLRKPGRHRRRPRRCDPWAGEHACLAPFRIARPRIVGRPQTRVAAAQASAGGRTRVSLKRSGRAHRPPGSGRGRSGHWPSYRDGAYLKRNQRG